MKQMQAKYLTVCLPACLAARVEQPAELGRAGLELGWLRELGCSSTCEEWEPSLGFVCPCLSPTSSGLVFLLHILAFCPSSTIADLPWP